MEFASGAINQIPAAVRRTGTEHVFIVTDPGVCAAGILDRVIEVLNAGGIKYNVFGDVQPNPSPQIVDTLAGELRSAGKTTVLALGGGSVMDAAKCSALLGANSGCASTLDTRCDFEPGLPVVAVPTTAGTGSETNGFGVIEASDRPQKIYIGHPSVRPQTSILDPELTLGLPAALTAATGMDALVHGIESLASRRATPISQSYAAQAIALVAKWLPVAVRCGDNLEARSYMLIGSHLAGLALSLSGLGLVHGIAHAITARVGAPHGLALSAVLPAVMDWCAPCSCHAYSQVARAFGVTDPSTRAAINACRGLADRVGARRPLTSFGVTPDMIAELAWTAVQDPVSANSPRRPTIADTAALIAASL
ncbi:iron-containing alcohol dehydrogenase [Streptomyces sp. NPDC051133]|uniref:iron-containing alcohol dehydrogenase family protein n=1 Tax=Streptomyces sp. NPDC051133 TaxID=3155521 RepID=UPI00343BC640